MDAYGILAAGLVELGMDVNQFKIGDEKSARGPCFMCGGHQRMVVFFNRTFPSWWFRCDMCGMDGWLDTFFPSMRTWTGSEELEAAAARFQKELDEYLAAKKVQVREHSDWKMYRENLGEENRLWWRNAGIPDDWQEFWGLGYTPHKKFVVRDEEFVRPAYTIPKFDMGWELTNIDYRLVDPPLGMGKYRPEYMLPASVFLSRPDFPELAPDGVVVVVEGSKKAMVTSIYLEGVQVVGVPAARSWAGIEARLTGIKKVVVVLDPDAEVAAAKLALEIGKNATRLTLPTKIDDAFLMGALTADMFWKLVRYSGRRT